MHIILVLVVTLVTIFTIKADALPPKRVSMSVSLYLDKEWQAPEDYKNDVSSWDPFKQAFEIVKASNKEFAHPTLNTKIHLDVYAMHNTSFHWEVSEKNLLEFEKYLETTNSEDRGNNYNVYLTFNKDSNSSVH